MKRIRLGRVTLEVAPKRRLEELVFPDELRVGDRVLVEMEVYREPDDYPVGSHVHARPARGTLWQLGDQHAWTWSTRQKNDSAPRIRRVTS